MARINQATWFATTYPKSDWKGLSSAKREKYRQEYQNWVATPEPTTPGVATMDTTTAPPITGEAGMHGEMSYADFQSQYADFGWTPERMQEAYNIYTESGRTPRPPGAPEPWETDPTIPAPGVDPTAITPTTTPTGVMPATTMPAPPEITPAPAYEISPEMQEMMDLYGDKLTDWVESDGYGLSPEVQAQMIQQQTDTLKARETENIRVMRNNMERRGITNSGFVYANEQNIRSSTSVAIAGAIADVQIKSALMKMASFEKGMGAMAQFLGFLSEQSQLAYAPKFATWQAEQLATMQTWQAKLDLMKMEINQAYQTQNIELTAQLQSQLAEQQHGYNLELAEIELETSNQAAAAQGIGSIFGTVLGFLFGK